MSHGEKNALIALLAVASAYFYMLAYTQVDLVEDAVALCILEEPGETAAPVAPRPQV